MTPIEDLVDALYQEWGADAKKRKKRIDWRKATAMNVPEYSLIKKEAAALGVYAPDRVLIPIFRLVIGRFQANNSNRGNGFQRDVKNVLGEAVGHEYVKKPKRVYGAHASEVDIQLEYGKILIFFSVKTSLRERWKQCLSEWGGLRPKHPNAEFYVIIAEEPDLGPLEALTSSGAKVVSVAHRNGITQLLFDLRSRIAGAT